MPRSAEGDVLTDCWADILEVLENDLIPFGRKACSADYKFVSESKVRNTHSKHAIGDDAKVAEIMGAVKTNITIQATPEKITQRFSDFVKLLHDLRLDAMAQRLVDELRKKKPSYVSPLPAPQEENLRSASEGNRIVEDEHDGKKKPSYLSGCWRYIAIILCLTAPVFVAAYYGLNPNVQELARNVVGRSWSFLVSDEVLQPRGTSKKWRDELTKTVREGRKSKARGLAVVVYNSYKNSPGISTLPGAIKDGEAMMDTFKSLQFAVLAKQDATRDDIHEIFEEVASYADYPAEYDCFAIVFAGHGDEDSVLLAIDGPFNFEKVIVQRLNKKIHKSGVSEKIEKVSKIAFIDACRGGKTPRDMIAARLNERDIPTKMMLCYSTREEDSSYENTKGGIWMQKIAQELKRQDKPVGEIVASVSKDMKDQNPISVNTGVDINLYKASGGKRIAEDKSGVDEASEGKRIEEKNSGANATDSADIPFYKDKSERRTKYFASKPRPAPDRGTKEHDFLEKFRLSVEVILQTVNENEYQAATTVLEEPGGMFERAVVFPKGGMVVGMFAKKRVALIQTDVGENAFDFINDAIETFPNALYVIGVGVCYAFNNEKYKLGDVLVSEQISNLANMKWDDQGRVENRGVIVHVVHDLHRIFCGDLVQDPDFKVSQSRSSEVYSGTIISHPTLINNKEIRDKFHAEVRTAIGGEMEGGQLLRFERQRKIKGIIAIKGICDYADGNKAKDWQFISALAALHYTKSKLLFEPHFIEDSVVDHDKQEVTQPRYKDSGGKRIEEDGSGVDETDGCIRQLEDDDVNSLSNYFGEACRTQTEIETLCDFLALKTATINELQRENKLNPRNIAKRYLDENPRACWANIVRVLCELSKNRIAMKVAKKYDLNINDCNELS